MDPQEPRGTRRKRDGGSAELERLARNAAAFARDPGAALRELQLGSPRELITDSSGIRERVIANQAMAFERALRRVGLAAPAEVPDEEPGAAPAPAPAGAPALPAGATYSGPGLTGKQAAKLLGFPNARSLRSRLEYIAKGNQTGHLLWHLCRKGDGRTPEGKFSELYVEAIQKINEASAVAARAAVAPAVERARRVGHRVARRLPELTVALLARGRKSL